jgi:hypothetical protein
MRRLLLLALGSGFALTALAQGFSETEALRLRAAKPGSVVSLPEALKLRPKIPLAPVVTVPDVSPQFLFSDQPEYFLTGNGIALQERVEPGFVRLYLYHVPTPSDDRKTITAVLENLGEKPLALRFLRQACPTPSDNYHAVVKNALKDFLVLRPAKSARIVPIGGKVPLDARLDATTAARDQLVHAIFEFEINQAARVTVLQRDPEQSSVAVVDQLPKLPAVLPGQEKASGAGRGLFPRCDFLVHNLPGQVLDTANGPAQLLLADGQRDPWMRGRDGIEGKDTVNVGNYGALYRIRLQRANNDGRAWALLLCQISGHAESCGKIGAVMKVNAGVWPGGVLMLPRDRVTFGGAEEAVLVQRFPPVPKGETNIIEITYSPPGACCLPTPLLFVPYEP